MLRRMLLSRPALMLGIFCSTVPGAAAGPIFTHATGSRVATPWAQGISGGDPTAASPAGPSGGVPQSSFWVEVQPGQLGSPLTRDPGASASGRVRGVDLG